MKYIFGYGSIVNIDKLPKFMKRDIYEINYQLSELKGYKRVWNVAKNNKYVIGIRKIYRDNKTGDWFDGSPVFLNIVPSDDCNTPVNGIIVEVDDNDLDWFDLREEHYYRVNVTDLIVNPPENAVIYAYVGTDDDIAFYEQEKDLERAKIPNMYIKMVEEGFKSFGEEEFNKYIESTTPAEVGSTDIEMVILK